MKSYLDILDGIKQHNEVQKLADIAEGIAKCKSRILNEIDHCKLVYGLNADGKILGPEESNQYIQRYIAIEKRLKRSYNNYLSKMTPFKTPTNEPTTTTP